jgi:ATP-dependent RNA helicase DeaD
LTHFNQTGLGDKMLQAIKDLGFETPTPVQEEVIPAILNTSENIIALAQTGTGKTAAFGLPLLEHTDVTSGFTSGLILCPKRELCIQITKDLDNYSKYLTGLQVCPVYGGADIVKQINRLKAGVHIVVGTPGRVVDLLKRKVLKVQQIKWLVLDEADEMLNMGFQEDLDTILADTPEEKRTLLFSATMPPGIRKIADKYMRQPLEITIGNRNTSTENVSHEFFMVHARDRYLALKRIADVHPGIYSIVFCRTRQETKDVAEKLINDGYNADALHGDLSQAQRDHVMGRFRGKTLQMLVATDVAARGLDVSDLTHVINYNLPDDQDAYIHRSGRTGRAGKQGVSISIIHTREMGRIRELERITGREFKRKMVPSGKEICEKQLFNLIDKMEHIVVNDEQIEQFMPVIYSKLEWLSREDLIKKFVSIEFNRFLEYYKNAVDINVKAEQKDARDKRLQESRNERSSGTRRDRNDSADFTRLFINLGLKDNLNPPKLIGLINDNARSRRIQIGKIDIQRNFSFFEVEAGAALKLINSFKGAGFEGMALEVNYAEHSKPRSSDRPDRSSRPVRSDRPARNTDDRRSEKPREFRAKSDTPDWKRGPSSDFKKADKPAGKPVKAKTFKEKPSPAPKDESPFYQKFIDEINETVQPRKKGKSKK